MCVPEESVASCDSSTLTVVVTVCQPINVKLFQCNSHSHSYGINHTFVHVDVGYLHLNHIQIVLMNG